MRLYANHRALVQLTVLNYQNPKCWKKLLIFFIDFLTNLMCAMLICCIMYGL